MICFQKKTRQIAAGFQILKFIILLKYHYFCILQRSIYYRPSSLRILAGMAFLFTMMSMVFNFT